MPGRQFSASSYRYGFNGKENDPESGTQDYGMRIYDTRLGRFLSVDPLAKDYSYKSPYDYAENDVIRCADLDGEEKILKVMVDAEYRIENGKVLKNKTPVLNVTNATECDQEIAKRVVQAYHLPSTGFGNLHYGVGGDYMDYFVDGKKYRLDIHKGCEAYNNQKNFNEKVYKHFEEVKSIINMFMVDFTLNRLGFILGTGKGSGVSENKIGGQLIIIDENIYSKTLMNKLLAEGYEVMIVNNKTTDAQIITKAKEMDAIILTNNVKDFANKEVKIYGASDKMKTDPQRVIDLIKKAEKNIKAGKADLKAPRGVSLANQEKL